MKSPIDEVRVRAENGTAVSDFRDGRCVEEVGDGGWGEGCNGGGWGWGWDWG